MPKKETSLHIVAAQKDFAVGDIRGNAKKIMDVIRKADKTSEVNLCIFPELALCGYPPEDLLFQPDFKQACQESMETLTEYTREFPNIMVVMGFPDYSDKHIFNALAFLKNGKCLAVYHKQLLPNYGVFDEKRYFTPGKGNVVLKLNGIRMGFLICEDIWEPKPLAKLAKENMDMLVVINASPFTLDKFNRRLDLLSRHTAKYDISVLYLNMNSAQDDLIFDGGSFWMNRNGELKWRADFFYEQTYHLQIQKTRKGITLADEKAVAEMPSPEALMYQSIVFGIKEYVRKNHIQGVVIGLSGGIDSALVLAMAVDAIGADRVTGVSMPSAYTSDLSITAAKKQADILGIEFEILSIDKVFKNFLELLNPVFQNKETDVTEENIQARCRGLILMAIANKRHRILLNTTNKSELAMGYGTLYGDMAGAYMVLKDVLKTWVYRLAHYRNSLSPIIPEEVISRAPTAELAPGQLDQDTLPPYEILDGIIKRYVEDFESVDEIVNAGYDPKIVLDVIRRIDRNEYKRRQGAPGPKVSSRAFTRDRRFPITSAWKW